MSRSRREPGSPGEDEYQQQAGGPRLAAELKQAQMALVERVGLRAGDLLVNAPLGLDQGDYKRALVYMMNGFGPPTKTGDQIARVGKGGVLAPEMITNVHPGLARRMGWQLG